MRSSSSLHEVVVPAILVAVEAGWVTCWLGATATVARRVPADVPFLAVALAAVVTVLAVAASRMLPARRAGRAAAVSLLVVVLAACTAGLLASLYLHGSFLRSGLEPWSVPAGAASAGTALAWFVASLAALRGAWLGWGEPSVRATAASLLVSAGGFCLLLLVATLDRHDLRLHAAAAPAAVLLVCGFPAGMAAMALVRERELERWRLGGDHNRPGLDWLVALMAPLAVVVLAAVALALAVGPAAPLAAEAARSVVHGLAALLDWLGRELSHLGRPASRPLQSPTAGRGIGVPRRAVHVSIPVWARLVAIGVAAAVGAVVLLVLLRALFPLWLRLRRLGGWVGGERSGESDSLFSWSHLLAQLRAVLQALVARFGGTLRRRRSRAQVGGQPPAALPDGADVRAQYRRVLAAAGAAGTGRSGSETPIELQRRLASGPAAPAAPALRSLTALYDDVRYGEREPGDAELELAAGSASEVVAALVRPAVALDEQR